MNVKISIDGLKLEMDRLPAIISSIPARTWQERSKQGRAIHHNGHITMLILSRRFGESIIINDNVTITVMSVKGKQVRIGIDAPVEVSVHREEIYDRIKKEAADDLDTPQLRIVTR